MYNIIQKLTSRKLWVALAGIVTGIAIALGADASEIQTVTGAVTAIVAAVTYIVMEGKIDAEAVKTAVESVQDAVDVLQGGDADESEN